MSDITTFEFTPFSIDEKKESAKSIENLLFNIPIYQRLYAWEEAEIKQLLEDLHRQFEKDRNSSYYLGNLVLYKNENGRYDVIDGQQRLTTLFLIGLVFKTEYADWSKFIQKEIQKEKEIRLVFVAREDDNAFLKAKIEGNAENIASENLNVMMTNAIGVVERFIDDTFKTQEKENLKKCFFDYVFHKTTMVGIIIPEGIDLNKYFEDMNNRGVQLEKHEILKAKLLDKIDKNDQPFYARLWDACSQMNQYVEYGFDKTLQKIRECLTKEDFINALKSEIANEVDKKENTLLSILEPISVDENIDVAKNKERQDLAENNVANFAEKQKNAENTPSKVGSILNFPIFILHSLKLFIADKEALKHYDVKLSDKDLLDVFYQKKENDPQMFFEKINSIEFIDFLFTCRVNYDAYFIKSIESTDGKTAWEINNISKNEKENKYERDDDKLKETAVIQAMLNASTGLDSWFTSALKYVNENTANWKLKKDNDVLEIDRNFCAFLENLDIELAKKRIGSEDYETWFNQNLHKGTGTPRYWFFRLDYYLRKEWLKEDVKFENLKIEQIKSKIENYQFRQNRSVEHIQPQSKKEGWEKDGVNIDNFGNLALISVRSNSSYNDQDFGDKKADFIKRTNNWGIESLKQLAIFEHNDWTAEAAETHGKEMIKILIESMSSEK